MKLPQCDREQEVVDALRSGRWASAWGDDIRQHAAELCSVCAEVAFAAQEIQHEVDLARTELQQPGRGCPRPDWFGGRPSSPRDERPSSVPLRPWSWLNALLMCLERSR